MMLSLRLLRTALGGGERGGWAAWRDGMVMCLEEIIVATLINTGRYLRIEYGGLSL